MKHSLLTILFLFLVSGSFSQKSKIIYDQDSKWFLSLGGGVAHHSTDVKNKLNFGFTAEFGYSLFMNQKSPISLDIGLRYLHGVYEGQDFTRFYGIANNPALNGQVDTNINYLAYPGYSVLNFRSSVNDISLEFQINTNKLRERTGVNLFLFGSVGFSIYRTLGNLSYFDNAANREMMYDYDSLNVIDRLNRRGLESIMDDTYESALEGSSKDKLNAKLTPSIGLGISYQLAPRIALGLEHRTTFTLTDLFDGNQFNNDNTVTSNKDLYHYTGLFLRFHIKNKKGKIRETKNENSVGQIDNYSTEIKPEVDIFDPSENPYSTDFNSFTIKAIVLNVDDRSQVSFKQNGESNDNFTYDPSTHRFESNVVLTPGQNVFEVRGTNSFGTDAENRVIILEGNETGAPPIVDFNNPSYSPYETSTALFQLSASILNVENPNDISISLNGENQVNFTFNSITHILTIPLNLNGGANTVIIRGTNEFGSDEKSTIIVYEETQTLEPPLVNFLNPGLNPFTTENELINVSATVLNVSGKDDILVKVNGQSTNQFEFNIQSSALTLLINLNDGSNVVEIIGSNSVGIDSKSTIIIKNNPEAVEPPIVQFINPNTNPFTVYNPAFNVVARIEHVENSNQINLKINGVSTQDFNFVPSSKIMTINSSLNNGANIFEITATNSAGSDSKNTTIILEHENTEDPPVVHFANPSANPVTVHTANYNIVGSVLNVENQNQIQVLINGSTFTNFNFDPTTKIITFPTQLNMGANVIQITGSNSAGSDSKSTVLNREVLNQGNPPIVTITNPNSNPYTSHVNTHIIYATIQNVDFKSQIQIRRNGMIVSPYLYSFDPPSGQITLNTNLVQGNNLFEITGTNTFGTDAKTALIVYQPVNNPCNKPNISFQVPNSNPVVSNTSSYSIKAELLNVANANNITLRVNGQIIQSFSFNTSTKILTKNITLNPGNNIVQIAALNSCGGSSISTFINYTQPNDPCFTPSISPIIPANGSYSSVSKYLTLKASVSDIANAQNLNLTLNGQNVNVSFDAGTHVAISNLTLNTGNNQVVLTAQNNCGTDTYIWNIYHSSCENPVVYMNNPSVVSTNVSNPNFVVSATISNIQNSNNIQFKRNGQNINFLYNSITNTFNSTVHLNQGLNSFELIGQNQCGNDTKQFEINYNPIQTVEPPTVDITTPSNSPFNTSSNGILIKAILDNVASSSEITVLVNGSTVSNFNYNPSSGNLSFFTTLNGGNNYIKITGVNQAGSDHDQTTIIYNKPISINPPQVTFTNPSSSPKMVAGKSYSVKGYVRNVSSASQVVFRVNGQIITNYNRTFNNGKMNFDITLNLSNANNIFNINVTATNMSGSDSDFRVVQYDLGSNPMGTPPSNNGNGSNGSGMGGKPVKNNNDVNQPKPKKQGSSTTGGKSMNTNNNGKSGSTINSKNKNTLKK